jgi:hypothetical protein
MSRSFSYSYDPEEWIMFMSLLRFNSSYRRRSRPASPPPPSNENQAVIKGIIEDLQILALWEPQTVRRIGRIVRGVVLDLNLREQQLRR